MQLALEPSPSLLIVLATQLVDSVHRPTPGVSELAAIVA